MAEKKNLREDALAIFAAALAAANAGDAVKRHLQRTESQLRVEKARFTLNRIGRVFVVCGGQGSPADG